MLPTQGLFRTTPCPYFVSGLCERSHCLFRHTKSDLVVGRSDEVESGVPNKTTVSGQVEGGGGGGGGVEEPKQTPPPGAKNKKDKDSPPPSRHHPRTKNREGSSDRASPHKSRSDSKSQSTKTSSQSNDKKHKKSDPLNSSHKKENESSRSHSHSHHKSSHKSSSASSAGGSNSKDKVKSSSHKTTINGSSSRSHRTDKSKHPAKEDSFKGIANSSSNKSGTSSVSSPSSKARKAREDSDSNSKRDSKHLHSDEWSPPSAKRPKLEERQRPQPIEIVLEDDPEEVRPVNFPQASPSDTVPHSISTGSRRIAHKPSTPTKERAKRPSIFADAPNKGTTKISGAVRQKVLDQLYDAANKAYDAETSFKRAVEEEAALEQRSKTKGVYISLAVGRVRGIRKEVEDFEKVNLELDLTKRNYCKFETMQASEHDNQNYDECENENQSDDVDSVHQKVIVATHGAYYYHIPPPAPPHHLNQPQPAMAFTPCTFTVIYPHTLTSPLPAMLYPYQPRMEFVPAAFYPAAFYQSDRGHFPPYLPHPPQPQFHGQVPWYIRTRTSSYPQVTPGGRYLWTSNRFPIPPNHFESTYGGRGMVVPSGDQGRYNGMRTPLWVPRTGEGSSSSQIKGPTGHALYMELKRFILKEEQLVEFGFPRAHPSAEPGRVVAKRSAWEKEYIHDDKRRTCDRCRKVFEVDEEGNPVRHESCIYHGGRRSYSRGRVNRDWFTSYSCCGDESGSLGCTSLGFHVPKYPPINSQKGFVSAVRGVGEEASMGNDKWDIVALDCEMVYTKGGNVLARATFLQADGTVLYDQFIKPIFPVLDYNTQFSGITEEMMMDAKATITDVQAILLANLKPNSILIGHSLESDLIALKLKHDFAIDTSVLFPHKRGPPFRRALRNLTTDYLQQIIQQSEDGHDSIEDAKAALELAIHFVVNQS